MFLKHFLLGFFAKTVTSLDDTVTKVPLVAAIAKTTLGKYAFAIGNLCALIVTLAVAGLVAPVVGKFAYMHVVLGVVLVVLAFLIKFDVFTVRERRFGEVRAKRWYRKAHISFLRLMSIGFVVAFVTLIDDTIVFLPLLADAGSLLMYAVGGILISTIIQLAILIYFAKALQKFRYGKELSFYGLLLFAALVFAGVV